MILQTAGDRDFSFPMKSTRSIGGSLVRHNRNALRGRLALLVLVMVIQAATALATTRQNDTMGAHVNFGRGCLACHSRHGQSLIDLPASSASSTPAMLWGDNVAATYSVYGNSTLQASSSYRTQCRGVLSCLSCHDGNYAPRAMMRNVVYEPIPETYGGGHLVPTLSDKDDFNSGKGIEDHPMGSAAQLRCGTAMGWDCVESHGAIRMQGTYSSRFAANYGFFVELVHTGETSFVFCTTCHNPHSMTWTAVTAEKASSFYPAGEYPTRHFLRAPSYEAGGTSSKASNRRAQFCRQCHADKSNEMNGSLAGTHP